MSSIIDGQPEAVRLYIHQIRWVQARLNMMDAHVAMCDGVTDTTKLALAAEMIELQLRLALESMALASLAANSAAYAAATKKYRNLWNAGDILKVVAKVNPNFYPWPARVTESEGSKHIELADVDFLTKDEFKRAYNSCSELLHALNPFKEPIDYPARIERARKWSKQANELIRQHVIEVVGHEGMLFINVTSDKTVRVLHLVPDGPFERGPGYPSNGWTQIENSPKLAQN